MVSVFGCKIPYFCGSMAGVIRLFILLSISSVLMSSSCRHYALELKAPNNEAKLKIAEEYYKKKDAAHALGLFEQLAGYYTGQAEQEKLQYYIAYCNYDLGNLDLASYLFKTYAETYPNSKNTEEFYYLYAYCHYLSSQGPGLDQHHTKKAIDELQLYINMYPNSTRIAESNGLIDQLRGTLITKAYRTAKLYYQIEDYKASIVALRNVVKDYPDIEQREEVEFLIVKSHFLLAKNSAEQVVKDGVLQNLKLDRFKATIDVCTMFNEAFGNSIYKPDIETIRKKATTEIEKLKT